MQDRTLSRKRTWSISLITHYLLAVAGGMTIGFLPEVFLSRLFYNTRIEAFVPAIAVTAFLLGYFLSQRIILGRAAKWTWIVGVLWLASGICDDTKFFNYSWSPEKFFGPTSKCSGSECIDEVLYTWPWVASVTYSVGAYLREHIPAS
jgi:hypothetical protein